MNSRAITRSPVGAPAVAVFLAVFGTVQLTCDNLAAQYAEWIWTADHSKVDVPDGDCHFRKSFVMRAPEQGRVIIWSDDTYELYVNGRPIGRGGSWIEPDRYDITRHLSRGRNLIAVKVSNTLGATAGLAVWLTVMDRGNTTVSHSTNGSWKTSRRALPFWYMNTYSDRRWKSAQSFGRVGETEPWVDETPDSNQRFQIASQFQVSQVLDNNQTGSLIAMTFNEFGHIIASREGNGLMLVVDSNGDGLPDKINEYCDKVTNCQGILALNGDVYVTADGPQGPALYRLSDEDQDGKLEDVRALVKFDGAIGEHGPHGIVLGPDGLIYVVVGNLSRPATDFAETGTHRNYYEGFLAQPKYEDPGGNAVGARAPGGMIIRTDLEGSFVELVAGGLRNPYDLAFNHLGDLLTHDSDMESDEGTPWDRPTRINHIVEGAEFGWRSGWAKWPEYFVDNLPAMQNTGRGSPTGMVVYDHFMFPQRYQNALFSCDWAQGRIVAYMLDIDGATYSVRKEVFLEGQPLNVTDVEVGPDGALYFCTGGRGTHGGVYRVTWNGNVSDAVKDIGEGISAVIRQPQVQSAWARQRIALAKVRLGGLWETQLANVARLRTNPASYRIRALHLLKLFGPVPSASLLQRLAEDEDPQVRIAVASLMGLDQHGDASRWLVKMLNDPNAMVRRKASESLLRIDECVSIDDLHRMLTSNDRVEAWVARRLLERSDLNEWRDEIFTTDDLRLFIQGATALMIAAPDKPTALAIIDRIVELMSDYVSDDDFVDMMRVIQLALLRGGLDARDVPALCIQLAEEFPASEPRMNRELARILVHLQATSIMDRYVRFLNSDRPHIERLHLALHLRYLQSGWTSDGKMTLLEFFEDTVKREGGKSYGDYVYNVSRDLADRLTDDERHRILAREEPWLNASFVALYGLSPGIDNKMLAVIKRLDIHIQNIDNESAERLKVAIVAILSREADEESMAYLRDIYDRDPQRRVTVAMGLAQAPEANWSYLVRSLNIVDGQVAVNLMQKLTVIDKTPDDPEAYRRVILAGMKLKDRGALQAIQLLTHWTGEKRVQDDEPLDAAMEAWQEWFATRHPDHPPAELPEMTDEAKWKFEELLEALDDGEGLKGSAHRGIKVFTKAQCSKCHRFGSRGERIGPDLTSVSQRFHKREILESILYPSQVISDQYASETLVTTGGFTYTGIVAPGAAGEVVVLQADGKKKTLREREIDERRPSRTSSMPAGLLDELTMQEIIDLFTYLGVPPPRRLASTRAAILQR